MTSYAPEALPPVSSLLEQLCSQIREHLLSHQIEQPLLVGIHTGGLWVAEHVHSTLGIRSALGSLDIGFYRDDFTHNGLNPSMKGSHLPESLDDRHIVLIDDVLMSGRTVRAAMNELFDYGRPASIQLACLLDVGQRQLPIQPDMCTARVTLNNTQRLKLTGPSPLGIDLIDA